MLTTSAFPKVPTKNKNKVHLIAISRMVSVGQRTIKALLDRLDLLKRENALLHMAETQVKRPTIKPQTPRNITTPTCTHTHYTGTMEADRSNQRATGTKLAPDICVPRLCLRLRRRKQALHAD